MKSEREIESGPAQDRRSLGKGRLLTVWCAKCELPRKWQVFPGDRLQDESCTVCYGPLMPLSEAKAKLGVVWRGDDYIVPARSDAESPAGTAYATEGRAA